MTLCAGRLLLSASALLRHCYENAGQTPAGF
jgi:hypothetical protein